MAISESYKANFNTLQRAMQDGNVAIMECVDAKTGKPVIAICAVGRENGEYVFSPLLRCSTGTHFLNSYRQPKEIP